MKIFILCCVSTLLSVLCSCQSRQDHYSYLGPLQVNFLNTQEPGSMVTFDENGTRTTTRVSAVDIDLVLTKEIKGGMFGGGDNYVKQYGTVYYDTPGSQSKADVYVTAADPYSSNSEAYQMITVKNESGTSNYYIDFKNKIPSKTINGVTYTDVILGIDSYRNDTLFWKKGIGILGWKRSDVNWTAYRVF